jgi:hypothetical protein
VFVEKNVYSDLSGYISVTGMFGGNTLPIVGSTGYSTRILVFLAVALGFVCVGASVRARVERFAIFTWVYLTPICGGK